MRNVEVREPAVEIQIRFIDRQNAAIKPGVSVRQLGDIVQKPRIGVSGLERKIREALIQAKLQRMVVRHTGSLKPVDHADSGVGPLILCEIVAAVRPAGSRQLRSGRPDVGRRQGRTRVPQLPFD